MEADDKASCLTDLRADDMALNSNLPYFWPRNSNKAADGPL